MARYAAIFLKVDRFNQHGCRKPYERMWAATLATWLWQAGSAELACWLQELQLDLDSDDT